LCASNKRRVQIYLPLIHYVIGRRLRKNIRLQQRFDPSTRGHGNYSGVIE